VHRLAVANQKRLSENGATFVVPSAIDEAVAGRWKQAAFTCRSCQCVAVFINPCGMPIPQWGKVFPGIFNWRHHGKSSSGCIAYWDSPSFRACCWQVRTPGIFTAVATPEHWPSAQKIPEWHRSVSASSLVSHDDGEEDWSKYDVPAFIRRGIPMPKLEVVQPKKPAKRKKAVKKVASCCSHRNRSPV